MSRSIVGSSPTSFISPKFSFIIIPSQLSFLSKLIMPYDPIEVAFRSVNRRRCRDCDHLGDKCTYSRFVNEEIPLEQQRFSCKECRDNSRLCSFLGGYSQGVRLIPVREGKRIHLTSLHLCVLYDLVQPFLLSCPASNKRRPLLAKLES